MALTMASGQSIGNVFFDAVFSTTHEANVTITTQPVQSGANIADHAYIEPDTVTMEIGASDASMGAGSNHSVNVYEMLRSLMEEREPISLFTRLRSYTDMMVVSISVTDDFNSATGLRASVMLQKILIVSVATVKVQQTVTASKSTAKSGSTKSSSGASTTKSSSSSGSSSSQSSSSTPRVSVLKQLVDSAKSSASKAATKATSSPSASTADKAKKKKG